MTTQHNTPQQHTLAQDQRFMARAIQLAKKGQYTTHPNPRVGCVIVKNGEIIGEGYHQYAGQGHAEVNAIGAVKASTKVSAKTSLQDSTAYVTLEPCSHTGKTPPCANALIKEKVGRVVIAMQDPNPEVAGRGIQRLKDANIDVSVGILEEQARALNPGFIKRMETGLPWLRVKLAMSLDGRTAMASGESQWITGSAARNDVQYLRAKADAILTGSGTVRDDDPSLNVRLTAAELGIQKPIRQPLRVVLDSQLSIEPKAKILGIEGKTHIYASTELASEIAEKNNNKTQKIDRIQSANTSVSFINKHPDSDGLDLNAVLRDLAKRQINEIHVEAGATLCGALLQQNLVDEIVLYIAPTLMGDNARGLLKLPGLDKMTDKIDLKINDIRAVGDDWRLTITPLTINH